MCILQFFKVQMSVAYITWFKSTKSKFPSENNSVPNITCTGTIRLPAPLDSKPHGKLDQKLNTKNGNDLNFDNAFISSLAAPKALYNVVTFTLSRWRLACKMPTYPSEVHILLKDTITDEVRFEPGTLRFLDGCSNHWALLQNEQTRSFINR